MTEAPISIEMLRARAALFASAREFFAARGVLEVDTPVLGHGLIVESHIDPIPCRVNLGAGAAGSERHLLASPEGPMKRLLAAGSGSIYQFAHAFRDGEVGRRHAPEFTLLEWYRPGFDHHRLMKEVEDLVRTLVPALGDTAFERCTYRDLFIDRVEIDPFDTSLERVLAACESRSVPVPRDQGTGSATLDDVLDLLLVGHIEPTLHQAVPLFVYDYPASQAALARVEHDARGALVGRRFELYFRGLELANGYHELDDATEQRSRFEQANATRAAGGRSVLPIDEPLLAALERGLPDCAGVALGIDRLLMIATGADHIRGVRPFPVG